MIRVHLFHDPADIPNCQTIEDIHQDNHHKEDKERKDDVAEPVSEYQVGIVHFTDKHDHGSDDGEPNVCINRIVGDLFLVVGGGHCHIVAQCAVVAQQGRCLVLVKKITC